MTADLQVHDPATGLTLSAAPELLPEDARAQRVIAFALGEIDTLRAAGHHGAADHVLDELCDYVAGVE